MSYTPPTLIGYNSVPPSDDGSHETQNEITWDGIESKLGRPLKVFSEAINEESDDAINGLIDDLASSDPGKGSELVGQPIIYAPEYLQTTSDIINHLPIPFQRFIPKQYHSAIRDSTSTQDLKDYFESAVNSGTSNLYFPRGTYKFDRGTQINDVEKITFWGDGRGSILKGYGGLNPQLFRFIDCGQIIWHHLSVDVNGTARFGAAPGFENCDDVSVHHCRFFDSNKQALEGHDRYGLIFIATPGQAQSNVFVHHNLFEDLQCEVDGCKRAIVDSNIIYRPVLTSGLVVVNVADGVETEDYIITNNTIIDPEGRGIAVNIDPSSSNDCQFKKITIRGNKVYYINTGSKAILIGTGNTGTSTSGNVFQDIHLIDNEVYYGAGVPSTYEQAIFFAGSTASNISFSRCSITGNKVYGNGKVQVGIDARYLDDSEVKNNKVHGASDSSFSITAASSCDISGNKSYGTPTSDFIYTANSAGNNVIRNNDNPDRQTIHAYTPGSGDLIHEDYKETVTGTATLFPYGISILNSTGGAVTATLPDGVRIGQQKRIGFLGSTSSTLSATHHATSDPEVFTFDSATDYLILEWDGTDWNTVLNRGVVT